VRKLLIKRQKLIFKFKAIKKGVFYLFFRLGGDVGAGDTNPPELGQNTKEEL